MNYQAPRHPDFTINRVPEQKLRTLYRADRFDLIDTRDRRYLDAVSGAYAAIFGYTNPDISSVMADASATLPFVHNARFRNVYADEFARRLATYVGDQSYRVYFSVSGSDGVEAAIRIALLYQISKHGPARTRTAALRYSYHGSTHGALSATGHLPARRCYADTLADVVRLTPPIHAAEPAYGTPVSGMTDACTAEAERVLGATDALGLAAFVVEPVMGNAAGSVALPREYLRRVADLCAQQDVVLIADEVTTGLGRAGPPTACMLSAVRPDILVLGKAITAGYFPMSAVLVSERIAAALSPDLNLLGHTHSAHPIGAAIGIRVLDRLADEELAENKTAIAAEMKGVSSEIEELTSVKYVRGTGLLYSVAFDTEYYQRVHGRSASSVVYDLCLEQGLLVMPGTCVDENRGVLSDHITLAPAFSMGPGEVEAIFDRLKSALNGARPVPADAPTKSRPPQRARN